jgi:hypothetical protein
MSARNRLWEAPVATALSIRRTANVNLGPGADQYLLMEFYRGPRAAAPELPAEAPPVPSRSHTVAACSADQRAWQAPAVIALGI